MMRTEKDKITVLLEQAKAGSSTAARELFDVVYDELKHLAERQMANQNVGHTLQTTALVNECYIKMLGAKKHPEWETLKHFFCSAARAMRHILVDHARGKSRKKRGEDVQLKHLDFEPTSTEYAVTEILAVNEALANLAALDAQKAKLVELRYFAGLTLQQSAEVLGISRATASRHWAFSRAWLVAALTDDGS